MKKNELRFDFQVLFDLCHRQSGLPLHASNGGRGGGGKSTTGYQDWRSRDADADRGFSISYMAEMLGLDPSAVSQWKKKGYVPFDSAERAASALGLTTMNIWPEYNSWVPDAKEVRQAKATARDRSKRKVAA
jgi:hypothetical protein